jgi:hypothetical protein
MILLLLNLRQLLIDDVIIFLRIIVKRKSSLFWAFPLFLFISLEIPMVTIYFGQIEFLQISCYCLGKGEP